MTNVQGHKLHPAHDPHQTVKKGNYVSIHYIGKLADGAIFETTNTKPLRFMVGEHTTIQGLEEGVLGMKVGEKKRIIIPAEKAYGRHHKDLIQEIPLSKIPREITPSVGMVLKKEAKTGTMIYTKIIKINRESVIIDLNHPLAGKTLVFDVVVMGIQ